MVIMKICLVGCHAVYFGKFVPTAVFAAPQNIRRRIALGSDILITLACKNKNVFSAVKTDIGTFY
jgi:hypothetical protein